MYYHDLFQLVVDLTSDSTDSSRSSRSSTPSTINLSSDPEDLFDDDDEDYANYEANDDVQDRGRDGQGAGRRRGRR